MKQYFRQFFWHNALVILIYTIFAGLTIASPWIMMKGFERLLEKDIHGFLIYMAAQIAVAFIMLLMNYSRNVEKAKVTTKMQTALREDITKRLEKASYSGFNKETSGTFISWLNNDVATINEHGFSAIYDVLDWGIMALFALLSLFIIHWQIGLASVALAFIVVFVPRLFQKKMTDAVVQFSLQKQVFVSKLKDVLCGFDVFFSFNLRSLITGEVKKASQELAKKNVYQVRKIMLPALILAFLAMISGLLILLYTGILVGQSLVAISVMIAIRSYTSNFFPHLANILSRLMNIKTVYPILQKFEQIEIIEENENAVLPEFNKGIEISNLNFAYDSGKPILKNVNMKFESGKKYGIIGESGCGKTTLFKLLVGMLENYDGKIEYDGIELSSLNKQDIRENIAYIDQSVYIFNDSIKKNICLSQNYSQEQIDKAIVSSALRPMIENLEQGIDTIASESGKNFSGGQRQRIAIARALIHGRKILLIDEGTSSLDKDNSLEIERQLIENPELTVIMVNHHFEPEIKAKLDAVYEL